MSIILGTRDWIFFYPASSIWCSYLESGKEGIMELKTVKLEIPEGTNLIFGQTHFIKTVEDLYEIMAGSMPKARFGIAFCEASGVCLIRVEGNDEGLKKTAVRNAQAVGAGHTFVLILGDAYPVNVLNAIKNCPEVCSIYCATANPVEVILAETSQGRGVLGVIDGYSPKGVEGPADVQWRKDLLRKIGYKIS
jgi:adenosine/AMP kinase